MICDPNEENPAAPVGASEHKDSADDCEEPDQANPEDIILKRTVCLEFPGVVGESHNAGHQKKDGDDRNGERAFVHAVELSLKEGR